MESLINRWVRALALGAVLVTVAAATATSGEDKPEVVAEKASQSWLAVVDVGKYGESWDQAAQSFKKAVTHDKWIDALKQVRDPLGKVGSRKLKGTEYLENPPNAPAGKYVIVQYDTDFENKKATVETVSLTLESDGHWRVAGYFIKPGE
ncbi:MAG TPA: DUF4019 domain-containing protein [Terriglobia bacterium]|nr:DUF4019 domain-containing protein [Terriglobia bacterium]